MLHPGGQAEGLVRASGLAAGQLRPGTALVAVAGQPVAGLLFAEVVGQIKSARKPVAVSFANRDHKKAVRAGRKQKDVAEERGRRFT